MRGCIIFVLLLCGQANAELYQRYTYYSCGRPYYGYKAYYAPAAPAYHTQQVSYNYTINYAQPAAIQGTTQYGVSDIASFYGDLDFGALFNQAARLADGAQKLSDKATTGYSALVATTSGDRTRVAEVLAKGQAASQALAAVKASDSATIVRHISGEVQTENVQPAGNLEATQQACHACHGEGAEAKGGSVHLPRFADLSKEQARIAKEYITRLDAANCARKANLSHEAQQELLDLLCKKSQ